MFRSWTLRWLLLLCAATTLQASSQTIPPVHSALFDGTPIDLPDALHGRSAVLILGFSQAAGPQVAAWGKRLAADFRNDPSVAWFEMPMLESVPRLLRGFVLRRIKQGVSEQGRATFLPIADHEAEWKALAGYKQPNDAYILVVDPDGHVRTRSEGPLNDAAYAAMRTQVKHP